MKDVHEPEIKINIEDASTEEIKKTLEEYFYCSICLSVVIDPKGCSECDNHFCSKCIDTSLKISNKCPFC
jgi:hypothetical protein